MSGFPLECHTVELLLHHQHHFHKDWREEQPSLSIFTIKQNNCTNCQFLLPVAKPTGWNGQYKISPFNVNGTTDESSNV